MRTSQNTLYTIRKIYGYYYISVTSRFRYILHVIKESEKKHTYVRSFESLYEAFDFLRKYSDIRNIPKIIFKKNVL